MAAKQLGSLELEDKKGGRQEGKLLSVSEANGISSLAQRERARERGQCNCAKHLKNSTFHFSLSKLVGFTLAEVLITLAVVGVVAAVTMPVLMTNINERVNSERHANIAYKITQAMEQMRAHGKLTTYASTDAFVDELQKYLKITKRCSASNIAECWPTETVTTAKGEEISISKIKTRKDLLSGSTINDNNVGLILADGASIILTYDSNAKTYDIGEAIPVDNGHPLPVGNGKSRQFAYTTGVTAPIDFVMDVNGKKGPNSETIDAHYNDIRSFRAAKLSNACTGERGSQGCVKLMATGSSWSPVDCTSANSSSADYQAYCGPTPGYASTDYWAGAKKLCREAGMDLPDVNKLLNISDVWRNSGQYSTELESISSAFSFWSSTEYEEDPYRVGRDVVLPDRYTGINDKSHNLSHSAVLCIAE